MKLTKDQLEKIVLAAFAAVGITEPKDLAGVAKSVKVGKEAEEHTESTGILGYFCIEDSLLSSAYYDAPSLYHGFIEAVDNALPAGAYTDSINTVEFGIYN